MSVLFARVTLFVLHQKLPWQPCLAMFLKFYSWSFHALEKYAEIPPPCPQVAVLDVLAGSSTVRTEMMRVCSVTSGAFCVVSLVGITGAT